MVSSCPWATRAIEGLLPCSSRPACAASRPPGSADPGNTQARVRESVWNARTPARPRVSRRTVPSGFAFAVGGSSWNVRPAAGTRSPVRSVPSGFPSFGWETGWNGSRGVRAPSRPGDRSKVVLTLRMRNRTVRFVRSRERGRAGERSKLFPLRSRGWLVDQRLPGALDRGSSERSKPRRPVGTSRPPRVWPVRRPLRASSEPPELTPSPAAGARTGGSRRACSSRARSAYRSGR